ncbi:hypothetical protein PPYR_08899 [Photinus pyralis]|uniref:DUF753 domain-containing protein n=1 Tax=Photinus pyralis TaxID=7054 RepID=A0A5N4AKS9_PHOPY|nr:hypothetical protein PPYR_08899 [Photinus pyralis]
MRQLTLPFSYLFCDMYFIILLATVLLCGVVDAGKYCYACDTGDSSCTRQQRGNAADRFCNSDCIMYVNTANGHTVRDCAKEERTNCSLIQNKRNCSTCYENKCNHEPLF